MLRSWSNRYYCLDFFLLGERPFTCEVCKNGYVSKASLKIHMRTHTNERPFVCDFCGKAFRQSGDLTSHKRLHGTEKPIECSVCQKRCVYIYFTF